MENAALLTCLTKQEIDDQAQSGKVSFGINYGDQKADLQKARDNAINALKTESTVFSWMMNPWNPWTPP